MGVSYLGHAVIGCEVTSKIPKTEMTRGCMHAVPEHFKCCPECGQARMVEVKVHVDNLPHHAELNAAGMVLASTTDYERVFAGIAIECWGDDGAKRRAMDFGNIKVDVRAALEPLGLWDDESFGLWCVMYCSY